MLFSYMQLWLNPVLETSEPLYHGCLATLIDQYFVVENYKRVLSS
jgi:hypothetical protein